MTNQPRLVLRASALALAATAALAGCSMFNPYRHFGVMPGPGADANPGSADGRNDGTRFAGGAHDALLAVDQLRAELYGDMKGVAVARSTVALTGIVTAGWAAYNALRPVPEGGSTPVGDRQRSARLALAAATSYAFGEFFVNPAQEGVYGDAYNALTCLMLQSRPLLMPRHETAGTKDAGDGSYDSLATALERLSEEIKRHHELVAIHAAGVDRAGLAGSRTDAEHNVTTRQLGEARRALQLARRTLADGIELKDLVDRSGITIRARAGLIVGEMNGAIRAGNRGSLNPTVRHGEARSITDAFLKLVERTSPDDGEDDDDEPGGSDKAVLMPALPAGLLATSAAAGVAWWVGAAATGNAARAVIDVQIDKLKAEIARKEAELLKLEKDKLSAQHKVETDKLRAELKAATDEQAKLKKQLDAQVGECRKDSGDMCEATALLKGTEELYAARRSVLHPLRNFRQMTYAARTISDCNANPAGLRLLPATDRAVYPGDTLTFIVSQGNGQTPQVVLHGNPGTAPAGKESLSVEVGTPVSKVTVRVGSNAPHGPLLLLATDAAGRHTESVRLTVQKPRPISKSALAGLVETAAAASRTAAASAAAAAEAASAAAAAAATRAGR